MVVVNYIIWTVINNFIETMPRKYREARDEYVTAMSGNSTRYRWKDCIDRMQPVFGMPLGLLFVDVAFDEKSKETVKRITQKVNPSIIVLPQYPEMRKVNCLRMRDGRDAMTSQ